MSEPFTPAQVRAILEETVKPTSLRPPADGVERLTNFLNQLQMTAEYRRDQLPAEVKRADAITWALRILTEEAPKLRAEYVAAVETAERWALSIGEIAAAQGVPPIYASDPAIPRSQLETLDALVAAAEAAKQLCIYPMALFVGIAQAGPVEHWNGYAKALAIAYHECCTGGSKEDGYRFIAAVTPRITGEITTFAAVKIEVLRQQVQKETLVVPGTS